MADTERIIDESWLWVVYGSENKGVEDILVFLVVVVSSLQDDSPWSIPPGIPVFV